MSEYYYIRITEKVDTLVNVTNKYLAIAHIKSGITPFN